MNDSDDFFELFGDVEIKAESPEQYRQEEENRQHKDIFEFRIKIYKWLFWSICVYIVLVLVLLAGNRSYFGLDAPVLIALLSTTSANILGVFFIASKWLFPNK